MSIHGRSLDDLPLAAYTTGVAPDEAESLDEPADAGIAPRPGLTQQDLAAALAASTGAAPAPAPAAPPARRRPRLPSLKLPSRGPGKQAAIEQAAPFKPVAQAPAPPPISPAPVPRPVEPAAFEAVTNPVERLPAPKLITRPVAGPPPGKPATGPKGRSPRLALRDPRVLAGGVIVVGVALLAINLLGGRPTSGSTGPNSSQDTTALLPTPVIGNASVELTAGATGTYTLTGATGSGPAVNSRVDATWTDPTGHSLALSGLASQGTRATDPNFVLSWTMLVNGAAVTFTSRNAECTVGMAVGPKAVHGNFVCSRLASPDGKHVLDLRGNYTT